MHLPKHIAIIMDGNGRWAKQRKLPRVAGHEAGLKAVKKIVQTCAEKRIQILTLFAFGQDNWKRPKAEVAFLMRLFKKALETDIEHLAKNNIQLRFIGDVSSLSHKLQQLIQAAEQKTSDNNGLIFVLALNYSGRWDVTQAVRNIAQKVQAGDLTADEISEDIVQKNLSLSDLPYPDLFIRTSGEERISNFLLWQLAYTELYFTKTFWPDFDEIELEKALDFFATRERRFGKISEQLR